MAWINVANPGRGEGAAAALASVLGYVGAVADRHRVRPAAAGVETTPEEILADPALVTEMRGMYLAITTRAMLS